MWIDIWKEQDAKRPPITVLREMYFQVEAEAMKNLKRKGFIDGMHSQDDVKYFVTYEGGEGVCLSYPGCSRNRDNELKFATIINEMADTFMVWGTTKPCHDYSMPLLKLCLQSRQELVYSCMLLELSWDHSQTLFLSSNYKLFFVGKKANVVSNKKKVSFPEIGSAITFGGDAYTDFVQHADGVFFVSLSAPIFSQDTINILVQKFKDMG
jgi:hypothetical protein